MKMGASYRGRGARTRGARGPAHHKRLLTRGQAQRFSTQHKWGPRPPAGEGRSERGRRKGKGLAVKKQPRPVSLAWGLSSLTGGGCELNIGASVGRQRSPDTRTHARKKALGCGPFLKAHRHKGRRSGGRRAGTKRVDVPCASRQVHCGGGL